MNNTAQNTESNAAILSNKNNRLKVRALFKAILQPFRRSDLTLLYAIQDSEVSPKRPQQTPARLIKKKQSPKRALQSERTDTYKPGLAWFCKCALVLTTFLLFAGGFTTSIDAGMAFRDWPLSDGSVNPEGWTQDPAMRAEHGHRLLGALLGMVSLILLCWTQLREARPWIRHLSALLLAMVILQGIMGGARVLFDIQNRPDITNNWLAQTFAIVHAGMALLTFCVLCALTLGTSRLWINNHAQSIQNISRAVLWSGCVLCALTFAQSLLGAIIRHKNVGMAIPFFPHATPQGSWLPDYWQWGVTLNFAHRLGAVLVTFALIFFFITIWKSRRGYCVWRAIIGLPLLLLILQILLGAGIILTNVHPHAATAHHLIGALFFGICWTLTFWAFRFDYQNSKESK